MLREEPKALLSIHIYLLLTTRVKLNVNETVLTSWHSLTQFGLRLESPFQEPLSGTSSYGGGTGGAPRELLSFGTLQWPSEDEIWTLLQHLLTNNGP